MGDMMELSRGNTYELNDDAGVYGDLIGSSLSKNTHFNALKTLWCEVILQAAKDIENGMEDAVFWLNSKDFIQCCQLAHIDDPQSLKRELLRRRRRRVTPHRLGHS
jgi:hypothetical protein